MGTGKKEGKSVKRKEGGQAARQVGDPVMGRKRRGQGEKGKSERRNGKWRGEKKGVAGQRKREREERERGGRNILFSDKLGMES